MHPTTTPSAVQSGKQYITACRKLQHLRHNKPGSIGTNTIFPATFQSSLAKGTNAYLSTRKVRVASGSLKKMPAALSRALQPDRVMINATLRRRRVLSPKILALSEKKKLGAKHRVGLSPVYTPYTTVLCVLGVISHAPALVAGKFYLIYGAQRTASSPTTWRAPSCFLFGTRPRPAGHTL